MDIHRRQVVLSDDFQAFCDSFGLSLVVTRYRGNLLPEHTFVAEVPGVLLGPWPASCCDDTAVRAVSRLVARIRAHPVTIEMHDGPFVHRHVVPTAPEFDPVRDPVVGRVAKLFPE